MIKRVFCILIFSLFLFSNYCFADNINIEEAKILYELGFYKGIAKRYFESDLSAFCDKQTALVLILRLSGYKENSQTESDYQINNILYHYIDKDNISDWAKKYVAYGIKNNIIPNIENNQLLPKRLIDGKVFTAMLLKSMGYSLNDDFWKISTYINSYLGGISVEDAKYLSDKILTKNDMIYIIWNSLNIKTSNDKTYIDSIVEKNNIQKQTLLRLGFEYSQNTIKPPVFQQSTNNIYGTNNKYNMKDGSSFFGENINGIPNGYGIINYEDGSKYEGNVVNGLREGEGKLIRNDGFVYSGSWKNDKMTGYGTLNWPNGDSYIGYLYSGYFEGVGTMVWVSGDKYSGEWIEGKFSGQGIFNWVNGNYYDGHWSFGEFDGYGIFSSVDIGVYEGQWKKGKKNGKGKFIFIDNTIQEGIWENDLFIGS
jgi:hypothetical protein